MHSNLGKWDRWYGLVAPDKPEPFGDSPSYRMIADYTEGLHVADWGCGKGWLRRFVPPDLYWGVDGSHTPFADEIADLVDYHTPSEAVVLRHVLEHDPRWKSILSNAVEAAQRKLIVVLFTPMFLGDEPISPVQIAWNDDPGVPDLSFHLNDITSVMVPFRVYHQTFESPHTQYGTETVIIGERA